MVETGKLGEESWVGRGRPQNSQTKIEIKTEKKITLFLLVSFSQICLILSKKFLIVLCYNINMEALQRKVWWNYVEDDLRELLKQSFLLLETFEKDPRQFFDYSFIVFPAAKAYEGFLKKIFLDLGFITSKDYFGKRFRIGKSLNPYLEKELRGESVYDRLVAYCGGKELADKLWETWRVCRNLIFHWFPDEEKAVSLAVARERVIMVTEAFDDVFKKCKIK